MFFEFGSFKTQHLFHWRDKEKNLIGIIFSALKNSGKVRSYEGKNQDFPVEMYVFDLPNLFLMSLNINKSKGGLKRNTLHSKLWSKLRQKWIPEVKNISLPWDSEKFLLCINRGNLTWHPLFTSLIIIRAH